MTKFTLPEGVEQKPKKFHERESAIEEYLVKRTKSRGGIAYKFTSPQRRSVPDRLVLGDAKAAAAALYKVVKSYDCRSVENATEEELAQQVAEIVSHMIHFVELKATGQKPTELQEREHAKLRERGFTVRVIDSKAEVDRQYLAACPRWLIQEAHPK